MLMSMLLYFLAGTFGGFDLGLRASAVTATEPSGAGTEENPYKISNANELYWFAANAGNKHFKLMNNITLNSGVLAADGRPNSGPFDEWTPVGGFTGVFDGNGKTISGIYKRNK